MTQFEFDGNYSNLEQVRPFYPAFEKAKASIVGVAYSSLFKGKIAGIAGDDEETAIYLLQRLSTEDERQARIEELKDNGYTQVKPEDGGSIKYASVVRVGDGNSHAGVTEYPKAKIVFADKRMFIVPKGHRTRGYIVWPSSLIFAK